MRSVLEKRFPPDTATEAFEHFIRVGFSGALTRNSEEKYVYCYNCDPRLIDKLRQRSGSENEFVAINLAFAAGLTCFE